MSFGLGRGRALDPGAVGVTAEELGPLPDEIMTDPAAAWVDPRRWFPEPDAPLDIEIGSGKGAFLVQQGSLEPGVNFLGIEWANEFYAYTADRLRRAKSTNVRALNADATEFLRWRCPSGIVRTIHLYFSDPWPKSRHHKKRVVQHSFLRDAWRVLEPGGEVRVVTDHDELWAWDLAHFDVWVEGGRRLDPEVSRAAIPELPGAIAEGAGGLPAFELAPFEPPESAGEGELIGTNFERKYRREGRPFHACVLRKL